MARRTVNKVEVIGFVGRDPEVRYTPGGEAVAAISIGTTESWKDKNDKDQQRTEWHRGVAFGKFAENVVGKLPKKGSYVRIEGGLRTRKWEDKNKIERYTTEIIIDDFIILDPAPTDRAPVDTPPPEEDVPF